MRRDVDFDMRGMPSYQGTRQEASTAVGQQSKGVSWLSAWEGMWRGDALAEQATSETEATVVLKEIALSYRAMRYSGSASRVRRLD